MVQRDAAVIRTTSRIAIAIAVILALGVPLGYFVIAYEREAAVLEVEGAAYASQISAIINAAPEVWQLLVLRLETVITRASGPSSEERRRITDLAHIVYVRQKEQRGIGDAVLTVREVVGNEPFVLFFPDDVIVSEVPAARQLIAVFEAQGGSVLAVEEVPREEVESYGIVDGEPVGEGVYRVRALVEKPKPEEAPSNLGIVGRYVLTPEIFGVLTHTAPGKGGEIQITDALSLLLQQQSMFAYQFQGRRYDTGRPLGLLKASVELALQRPDMGAELRRYLRGLDLSD